MRNKGTFNFSGNLEVKKDAPLEAGSIVPTYADLTKAETWTDEEGSVWVYKGKNVTCEDRPGKLYQLTSTDYTKTSNWVEIGGGGTGGGIVEAPEDGKLYGRQNATWSEINDYIMIPEGIMFLENTSTSDEILDAFGGLDQFIELTNEIASNNKPLILAANYTGTSQSIVFIFAMCSTESSSLNRTLNLYSQVGSDLNSILIRYENGQASFTKIIKGLQTTGPTIEISDASLLTTNANLSDTAASNRIISIFGNEQNFRNVVNDIIFNRTRYWFNVTGANANIIEMSSVNAYKSQDSTIYELHFIITYYTADNQITKRISIIQARGSYHVKINDIMQSNNLTTATKISATDYAALDPKDASTMYAVTE